MLSTQNCRWWVGLFVFCWNTASVFSQKFNVVPATIVTTAHDTLRGHIKDKRSFEDKINFRPNGESNFKALAADDVQAFWLDDERFFQSIALHDSASQPLQKVFLLNLAEGQTSLFKRRNQFIVIKTGHAPVALSRKEQTGGSNAGTRYQGILAYLMADCPAMRARINRTRFDASSLAKTIAEYNACIAPDAPQATHTKSFRIMPKWGFRLGLATSTVAYIVEDARYYGLDLRLKTGFSGGFLARFSMGHKFSVQPEILLSQKGARFDGQIGTQWTGYKPLQLDFDLLYLQLPINFYFHLPMPRLRPFVSAGGVFGYALSRKATSRYNDLPTTNLPIDKDELGFRAGVGVDWPIHRRRAIGIEYAFERTLSNRLYTIEKFRNISYCITLRTSLL